MPASAPSTLDLLLRVRGTVQGVGFRPFVQRTATARHLRGWVRNDSQGVLIRVTGEPAPIDAFIADLADTAPAAARVTAIERLDPTPGSAPAGPDFVIAASDEGPGQVSAAVPPDLALCADCRRELLDPADRRHDYPFINCTQCGPRYSLIEQLPYDRPRTTMRAFRLCPTCEREYHDPADRRFHAEPNACPTCGPRVTLTDPAGQPLATGQDALLATAQAWREGRIVAVKGLGGYHLMCDATRPTAVALLRQRKHREEKPLAVMFRDLDQLRAHALVSAAAARLLASPAAPIVLVPRRPDSALAPELAPANPWLGALLPYTPLHLLLLRAASGPVVATSANLSEEPLCTDNTEARERLAGLADFFLAHDRPIARPVDDSVVRESAAGAPILLRRARGLAPAPLPLPASLAAPVLCVGGHMKNTVAIASGRQVVVSPHLGDLGNAATQAAFERTTAMLAGLFATEPALVAHDKHPDYASTRFARRTGLPTLAVQHHLAHVLACLLEHRRDAHRILGVAWDGTGCGEDNTIWGGEFILLQNQRATRFARLRPFRLPGGEAAVRDARRVALGLAHETGLFDAVASRLQLRPTERAPLQQMLAQGLNSPVCTSAGRLFDAVNALLGLGSRNTFEGQAPMQLEAAATTAPNQNTAALPFDLVPCRDGSAVFDLDWEPALRVLLSDPRPPAELAAAFHRGLADAMRTVARRADVPAVALTGGCFQNALLHDLATAALTSAGLEVLAHRELSPNDNSIAAGQALAALWNLTTVHRPA